MNDLITGVLNGRLRAIARLITQVENDERAAETAVMALYPHTGRAHILGVTGPPGSGKSTLVNELAKVLRQEDQRIAIIAVDPSSPFTGGALLGDRVRMRDLAGDKGVFIRSMASRGSLGGLARATWAVINVLDAAGFDMILVETVGAGQAEVDIARAAHTTLVIEAPGMGDDIQSFKAGILEIADILVVNKADRPSANQVVRSLEMMLHLGPMGGTRHHGRMRQTPAPPSNGSSDAWQIPVQTTIATTGEGIADLVTLVHDHQVYLQSTDGWLKREQERCWQVMQQLLQAKLAAQLQMIVSASEKESLVMTVAERKMDPYTAVGHLFAQIQREPHE